MYLGWDGRMMVSLKKNTLWIIHKIYAKYETKFVSSLILGNKYCFTVRVLMLRKDTIASEDSNLCTIDPIYVL